MTDSAYHIPVLMEEVLRLLDPKPGDRVFDVTAGGGGHAAALLERILPGGSLLAADRDEEAVEHCRNRFKGTTEARVIRENLGGVRPVAKREGLDTVDIILADLGIASRHVQVPARGFSFRHDGPLDMRFSTTIPESAADLVNRLDEKELTRMFREWGEERWSGPIARMIIRKRPIQTTALLADVVRSAIPRSHRSRKIHPATRVFQALRIAVNSELDHLADFLRDAPGLLAPGGRLGVISYHSLEDRAVKHTFRELARSGFELLTRRAVMAQKAEVARNVRARSARLRVVRKV